MATETQRAQRENQWNLCDLCVSVGILVLGGEHKFMMTTQTTELAYLQPATAVQAHAEQQKL